MNSNAAAQLAASVSRRTAIGFGVASGLAFASLPTEELLAKTPPHSGDMDPQLSAAWKFAVKSSVKCVPGYWAVSYPNDNFAGDPLLIGNPVLIEKPQSGAMPLGWGAEAGSIVVGPRAVLRLIHKVNGQDTHITLLPCETLADMRTAAIADGASSWKLFPADALHPPY